MLSSFSIGLRRVCLGLSFGLLMLCSSCDPNVVVVPDAPPTAYDARKFDADPLANLWFDCATRCTEETSGFSEPVAARSYAYISLALYEAILPGLPRTYRSLSGQLFSLEKLPVPDTVGKRFHWTIVANAAVADVMRNMFIHAAPAVHRRIDSLETLMLTERAERTHDTATTNRSVAFGKKIAAAIIAYADVDGGKDADINNYTEAFDGGTDSSSWTPSGSHKNPLLARWSTNRPFFITTNDLGSTLDPGPFPTFSARKNSDFYNAANEVRNAVMSMPVEDRSLVEYWGHESQSPQNVSTHMINITTQLLRTGAYNLGFSAELYARMCLSMNDACIATWNAKYKYPLLRPVDYITRYIDKNWKSNSLVLRIVTPPSPEYCSHTVAISRSSISVIESVFGKNFLFTDRSRAATVQLERDYYNFEQILNEVQNTQLQSGTQFTFSMEAASKIGARIAVLERERLTFNAAP